MINSATPIGRRLLARKSWTCRPVNQAKDELKAMLEETDFSCVLVGAGVRTDTEEFLLFEKLINIVHEHAPGAKICFNTGPTDSVDAIRRWS